MRLAILVFIQLAAVQAQSQPWWDLSGQWRYIEGDDPRYAAPAFDDSNWSTIPLPGWNLLRDPNESCGPRYFWLRKSIEVPAGTSATEWALTLGKLTENYTVFLNGTSVGQVGDFTAEHAYIARPQVFDLPPLPGRITIAIRAWDHDQPAGSTALRNAPDTGPYKLVPSAFANRNIGTAFVNNLRLTRTLDLVVGVALVSLSLIPFLMYLGQRHRSALFWLGAHALLVGVRRLILVTSLAPDSLPWATSFWVTPLHMACLPEFAMAAVGAQNRWLRAALWLTVLTSYLGLSRFWVLQLLTAVTLLWVARQPHPRRWEKLVVVTGCMLVFLAGARQDEPASWMQSFPNAFLRIGPYAISAHSPLTAVLTLVMILVLTRRLLGDAAEKQRMQGELEAARLMQQIMVKTADTAAGFLIDSAYVPAQEVGGDFYQVLALADGAALVIVGDVSGKGLRAAMVVSMLTGAIANRRHETPAALLAELNQVLCGRFQGGFVTAVCLRLEPDGGVRAASAGHPAPYCEGQEAVLESGLPLGIAPDTTYEETTLHGKRYTLVSDGVAEAANSSGELFGFDRTAAIAGKPATEIAATAQSWGQTDDITIVTVQKIG